MVPIRLISRLSSRSFKCVNRSRALSTNVYGESFNQLRAFPFQLTPIQAEKKLARWASLICDDKVPTSAFPDISEFFGFEYKRPDRMVPVYFPAWIFNTELEFKATQKDVERDVCAQFVNSYLPGSHLTKLASAPLWFKDPHYLFTNELQPFTDDLLRQHDLDVQCIPYTISPFSLLELPKSLPPSTFELDEDLKISPSTIKANLFAAYPILLPVYLAQFTTKGSEERPSTSVTMIVQAYSEVQGGVLAEPFFDVLSETHRITFEKAAEVSGWDLANKEIINFDDVDDQLHVLSAAFQAPHMTEVCTKVVARLQNGLHTSKNMATLASLCDVDIPALEKDPRIRTVSFEEQSAIDQYILTSNELQIVKNLVETIANPSLGAGDAKVIVMGKNPFNSEGGDLEAMKSAFAQKVQELELAKEEATPQWLVEHRISQKSESNSNS